MKKLLSFMLILVLTFGLLAGCSGGSSNKDDTQSSGSASTDGLLSTADIVFVENGESVYKIIRPEDPLNNETTLGGVLVKRMKETIGISIKNSDDSADGTDAYEILIGNTNRVESQQALDLLLEKTGGRYNDYIICSIGKKIVINALNADSLELAVNYFVENYLNKDGIKGGLAYFNATEGDFKEITVNGVSIGKFNLVRQHLNGSYLSMVEMENMQEVLVQKTGYYVPIVHDNTEAADYEIIVGNCARDGVKSITKYDEYDITVSGKKIYLNGGSPHATAMAVSEFTKMLEAGEIKDSSATFSYESAMLNYDRKTTYYPTWYDTFDGSGIDLTKWRVVGGTEFGREGQNGKWSGMSDDPNYVFVTDGKFYIYGQETEDKYLGGTIKNDKTMRFHYGYVEFSAICPNGPSFWSLLWFCGSGGYQYMSPEIDLNECFGNGKVTAANCHAWPTTAGAALGKEHTSLDTKYGSVKKYYCPDGKTWADDWHTFGFLWDEDEMTFVGDGDIFFSYQTNTTEDDIDAFVNSWMYMQFSFSVGRLNNGEQASELTDEHWSNSSAFVVDWVYLYQYDDGLQGLELL